MSDSGKDCPKCGKWKFFIEFRIDRTRPGGRSGWCKLCSAENGKLRRSKNLAATRKRDAARYAKQPRAWHARVAVRRAIQSGKLLRPESCQNVHCQTVKPYKPEAYHHAGLEKENVLKVVWLCRPCGNIARRSRRLAKPAA